MLFYVTDANADIERLKYPYKYFERYRMIRKKFGAFWQKGVNCFWQSVDAILEEVFLAKVIDANQNTSIFHYMHHEIMYEGIHIPWKECQLLTNIFASC